MGLLLFYFTNWLTLNPDQLLLSGLLAKESTVKGNKVKKMKNARFFTSQKEQVCISKKRFFFFHLFISACSSERLSISPLYMSQCRN